MRTKTIFTLLPILFAFTLPTDKDKGTLVLNTANRDKIKTISLASVYGENKGGIYDIHYSDQQGVKLLGKGRGQATNVREYTFTIFDQQQCYDYLEKVLVDKFNAINMSVASLDKTKPLFSDTIGNLQILNDVEGRPAMTDKDIKKWKMNMDFMAKMGAIKQQVSFTDKWGMNLKGIEGTKEISSANTAAASLMVNMAGNVKTTPNVYSGRAGVPDYNDNFVKTFARVAKKANTDGFALVRMESCFGGDSTNAENKKFFDNLTKGTGYAIVFLYVSIYTNDGDLAFHDEVMGYSKEALKSGCSNSDALLTDAMNDAVRITFTHLTNQK
jgi:hypothetical protein